LAALRDLDAASAVIAGLDPAIQTSPWLHPDYGRKTNETSASLDRRVKPGDDGGGVARLGQTNSRLNRTAVGQARDSAASV
jgi:hypothetical protein